MEAKWQRTKIEASLTVGYCTVGTYVLPRDLAFVEYATPERDSHVVRCFWPFFSAFIECQKNTMGNNMCASHVAVEVFLLLPYEQALPQYVLSYCTTVRVQYGERREIMIARNGADASRLASSRVGPLLLDPRHASLFRDLICSDILH